MTFYRDLQVDNRLIVTVPLETRMSLAEQDKARERAAEYEGYVSAASQDGPYADYDPDRTSWTLHQPMDFLA